MGAMFRIATVCLGALCLAWALQMHFEGVADQLIGGDQEHTLRVALQHDYGEILSDYDSSDNSIPLTLYGRLPIEHGGLTEMGMRLPIMIFDVSLLLAPLLLLRRLGLATTAATMLLLACCPLVIHYAVVVRPYTPATVFTFLAFIAWDRWLHGTTHPKTNTGLPWAGLAFAVCGALAIFWHLYCLVPIATLLLLAITGAAGPRPPWRKLLLVSTLCAALVALLLSPGFSGLIDHRLNKVGSATNFWESSQHS
ncbi:MAG: hypothetical protein ACI9EF_001514 [Pseudohongiellaceae bacterium]|jgi:hypothetical protein